MAFTLNVDTRRIGDDFMDLLDGKRPEVPTGVRLMPVQTRAFTRVFPDAASYEFVSGPPPTMGQLREWMADLPVMVVEPRRPHRVAENEWDDCDDCMDLFHAAEDVNRDAQMTAEERAASYRTNFEAYMAALQGPR